MKILKITLGDLCDDCDYLQNDAAEQFLEEGYTHVQCAGEIMEAENMDDTVPLVCIGEQVPNAVMTVPEITESMGKNWKQPPRSSIFIVGNQAFMSKSNCVMLAEYNCSVPSGVYDGKMWKCNKDGHVPKNENTK